MISLRGQTCRKGIPPQRSDAIEETSQGKQIKLEGDGSHLPIFPAPNQFGLTEIHGDLPSLDPRPTLEANPAKVYEWFEEFGDTVDEVGEPRGASGTGLLVLRRFDLPDQVLQGEMRMTHVDAGLRDEVSGGAMTCLTQVCFSYREVALRQ